MNTIVPTEAITTANSVALVCGDGTNAAGIASQLGNELGQRIPVMEFDSVWRHLNWDTDGLLLVFLEDADEIPLLKKLLQHVSLLRLPVSVTAVIKAEARSKTCTDANLATALKPFRSYLSGYHLWPKAVENIVQLGKAYTGSCPFVAPPDQSLKEQLRRQLQAQTPSLVSLAERISLAANHDVTVLLTGETGTGKTFVARLIHDHSRRKSERFLAIPCGALSANLVESEFFGHVKGAFTGADRAKIGKFAAVGRGTLLLDEIDTLGLERQATLLRVIETGEFEPVGSVETQTSEARLIVASNIYLEDAVQRGEFRADLYYRLNVMSFHLPPLRERVQDVAPLAQHMAARFNRQFGKDLFHVSSRALAALETFPWPGNIRQLENAIQHGVLVSSGPELLLRDLPEYLQKHFAEANRQPMRADSDLNGHLLEKYVDNAERDAIHRALVQNGYNRRRTAELLGISRVTLYKKMKKYQLMSLRRLP